MVVRLMHIELLSDEELLKRHLARLKRRLLVKYGDRLTPSAASRPYDQAADDTSARTS